MRIHSQALRLVGRLVLIRVADGDTVKKNSRTTDWKRQTHLSLPFPSIGDHERRICAQYCETSAEEVINW